MNADNLQIIGMGKTNDTHDNFAFTIRMHIFMIVRVDKISANPVIDTCCNWMKNVNFRAIDTFVGNSDGSRDMRTRCNLLACLNFQPCLHAFGFWWKVYRNLQLVPKSTHCTQAIIKIMSSESTKFVANLPMPIQCSTILFINNLHARCWKIFLPWHGAIASYAQVCT